MCVPSVPVVRLRLTKNVRSVRSIRRIHRWISQHRRVASTRLACSVVRRSHVTADRLANHYLDRINYGSLFPLVRSDTRYAPASSHARRRRKGPTATTRVQLSIPQRMPQEDGIHRLRPRGFSDRPDARLRTRKESVDHLAFAEHCADLLFLAVCTFSRLMLERWKIVVVVVAYPATSLCTGRVRFCLSSAHTKSDLDQLLRACDDMYVRSS